MSVTKIRLRTWRDNWEFVHEAEITTYGHYYPQIVAAVMPGELHATYFDYAHGRYDGALENEYWQFGSVDVARVHPEAVESNPLKEYPVNLPVPKQIPREGGPT